MAENHVRAVQTHSKVSDRLTRHILEIIALDIGRDDSPAYTSNRKIAGRARTAVNTARKCINALIESGELIAIKDGKMMLYSLSEDLIPYPRISGETRAKTFGNQATTQSDLSDIVSALSAELDTMLDTKLDTIGESLYQKIVSIVSSSSTGSDIEVREDKNKNIYIHPDPEPIQRIKSALSKVSKTPQTFVNSEEYSEAAQILIGWEATPEALDNYLEWWAENGYYGGLPSLKSILGTYRNFLLGIQVSNASPNGNGQHSIDLWQSQVSRWIDGKSKFSDLSPPVRNAIKQIGGDGLKNANNYAISQAKKKFSEIMKG